MSAAPRNAKRKRDETTSFVPRTAKRKRDETTYVAMRLALERSYKHLNNIIDTRTESLEYLEKEMEQTVTQGDVASVESRQQKVIENCQAMEDAERDKIDTLERAIEVRQDVMVAFAARLAKDENHPLGKEAEVGLRDMILRLS